ncbi:hypothetical protein Y1Q_0017872 [Alligator mississippiensis]|uniref:Uncharacterized protein n=1 Tax=Alligator mississippiensis TaxID=8496 RepID=A0A151PGY3_ALLMI|nr:hypothetical protein Y1Q_0017872 [Alligator mississippiensis]
MICYKMRNERIPQMVDPSCVQCPPGSILHSLNKPERGTVVAILRRTATYWLERGCVSQFTRLSPQLDRRRENLRWAEHSFYITGLSETTARYSSVTALSSTLVPFKNFTKHTTSGESNPITSATALKPEAPHPTADSQNVSEALDSVPTTQVSTEGFHLKNSEDILSIGFSSTFVFAVLVIIMHSFLKYRKRKAQYSHRPLHDISSETGDIYTTPDDTLVISGGLYDAPRIYNPNVTALDNDEVQADYLPFGSRSGQFKLEFSLDEKDLSYNFETFQSLPQDSQCSDIVPNTQHTFSDYNLNPLIAL